MTSRELWGISYGKVLDNCCFKRPCHARVSRGFAQAGHGKRSGLVRMHTGDVIVCYSPKKEYAGREPLKAFTALGFVEDEEIYQTAGSPDFHPFRRRVRYIAVKDVPALPLVSDLTFIRNKKAWSFVMRFGLLEIAESDFRLIATAMGTLLPVPETAGWDPYN